jgi:hypothetical protein
MVLETDVSNLNADGYDLEKKQITAYSYFMFAPKKAARERSVKL